MLRAGRLSGSLPFSIAIHLVVLLLVFIIPIFADVAAPDPPAIVPRYMAAVAIPDPVVPRVAPAAHVARAATPALVPLEAPTGIAPEAPKPGPVTPDVPIGDAPPGIGTIGAIVEEGGRLTPPPPSLRPPGPVRVSELVQPPRKTVDVRPVYPDIARQARVEGTVVLEAILDRSGRVDQLRVIKSVPLLDQAAIDAVQQWRYTPTVLNGQPVAVLMTITIRFMLQQ